MSSKRVVTGDEVPGAVFTKTYRGRDYQLEIVANGDKMTYVVNGESFRTPTAAALAVTGWKTISGREFWGMPKKR